LREDHGKVAAVQRGHWQPTAGQLYPRPRAVHSRGVAKPAGGARRGSARLVGKSAGAPDRRDHHVTVDRLPVHDHPGGAAVPRDQAVGVPGALRQSRLAVGGAPEDPFEGRAAALQPGHLCREARRAGRNAPGGDQRVPYVRQSLGQHLTHNGAEEVRQQELHHPLPPPPANRGRARIPVHHDHVIAPSG
jgi:hypothetical protein